MGQRLNPFGVLQVVHLVRQDLSIAGKRAGLAGARSGLFMEQVRIVKEMREADKRNGRTGDMVRPRYLVWENVVGAFSSNKGKDFAAVLEEIIKIVEPEAPGIEVPEKGWPTWGGYHDEMGGRWSVVWRTHDAQHWGVPQRRRRISVVADFGGDTASEIQFDGESLPGDITASGASGEGFAETAEAGASYAVRIRGGCDVIRECGEQVPALQARMGTGGNQVPLTYGIGNGQANEAGIMAEEVSQTLNTMHDAQAVMCEDVSHALRAKANCAYRADAETYICSAVDCRNGQESDVGGALQARTGHTLNANGVVRSNMVVRRLTPLECTRLQGYPDGWVDIGDWTDEKGKKHKDADSPKYKALGNSIALPFWDWMLRRMARYLPEGATLGSLFDGIGGFPLCFERIHGRGTARWASEIEPFPIAVTKKWFGEE